MDQDLKPSEHQKWCDEWKKFEYEEKRFDQTSDYPTILDLFSDTICFGGSCELNNGTKTQDRECIAQAMWETLKQIGFDRRCNFFWKCLLVYFKKYGKLSTGEYTAGELLVKLQVVGTGWEKILQMCRGDWNGLISLQMMNGKEGDFETFMIRIAKVITEVWFTEEVDDEPKLIAKSDSEY